MRIECTSGGSRGSCRWGSSWNQSTLIRRAVEWNIHRPRVGINFPPKFFFETFRVIHHQPRSLCAALFAAFLATSDTNFLHNFLHDAISSRPSITVSLLLSLSCQLFLYSPLLFRWGRSTSAEINTSRLRYYLAEMLWSGFLYWMVLASARC